MAREKNRYEEIIIESARLFRERGYLATSIRDIGDALNITSAALYYHFKNKEEVLVAVMNQALKRVSEAVSEAISAEPDPSERIRLAMRTHLAQSADYQDFAIVLMLEQRHLSAAANEQVQAGWDAYDQIWKDLFQAAQDAGYYRENVDVRLLRLLTFGAMNRVVDWYRPTGAYKPEEIADALFSYARDGVSALNIDPQSI